MHPIKIINKKSIFVKVFFKLHIWGLFDWGVVKDKGRGGGERKQ